MTTAFAIPCIPNGQARWTQRTALDGRDYQLTFEWNSRDGHWWLSIADQNANPIKSGIKLVSNWPLLGAALLDTRRPPGELFVIDVQAQGLDPGFSDLGSQAFPLMYSSPN